MLILTKLSATWCGPCKTLAPIVKEIWKDLSDKISLRTIDIDEHPESVKKYNIHSIPYLVLEDENGKILWSHTGTMSKNELKITLEKFM
jgi:thioredoxin 1